jgi:photosystem II stability/assembly factor-like uncharacterized protein
MARAQKPIDATPDLRRVDRCSRLHPMNPPCIGQQRDAREPRAHKGLSALFATVCLAVLSAPGFGATGFKDPLDNPARTVDRLDRRPMQAVAWAGERLVAVGSRGLIAVSTDRGSTWKQARVPVQSDLLAVYFPAPQTGWAVGHDGVVLRSDDGGDTWVKQLDGRSAADTFLNTYRARADRGDPAAKQALKQLDQNFKVPGALPYLDVWFKDVEQGYAVGSFGMLAATTDGGKTWVPWLDRIDNDQFLNLNCIHGIGDDVFIAGERGQVFKLDPNNRRFLSTPTGYAGSFFGIAGDSRTVLVFGLRGVAYRSRDRGSLWEAVRMPSEATISAGIARDSGFVLVNSTGQILTGDSEARQFSLNELPQHLRLTGVASLTQHSVLVTGQTGIAVESLESRLMVEDGMHHGSR